MCNGRTWAYFVIIDAARVVRIRRELGGFCTIEVPAGFHRPYEANWTLAIMPRETEFR